MKRKRSKYAIKQGRRKNETGRTRYAPTSPFSPEHQIDWSHRLARAYLHGQLIESPR